MEWSGPEDRGSALSILPVARKEIARRPLLLFGMFAAIALGSLALGIVLPKKYTSTTTILVEESNIIAPLMEGRAVPTGVAKRASIAREVAFSRRVMNAILRTGGWLAERPDPLTQERLIDQITDRTHISTPRDNLIQISYTDADPKRSFEVTKRFADLVIEESLATKGRESRDAYEFINSQVGQYHRKLTEAESKLEQYRQANPDARAGIESDVNARIGELRRLVETSRMELLDLQSQDGALQAQLSGESEVAMVHTRAGQLMGRLAELKTEHDRLLLTYTDQHPDVIRVQHQIRDLEADLRKEDVRRQSGQANSPGTLEGPATFNPLYAELKSKQAEVRRRSAAMGSRISAGEGLLGQELARSGRIAASESSLSELSRDYEVNRDLYQDLLKRRENARVSMNLDAEQRGLSFRIQEPAAMPLRPSGLRLLHVAGAGLALAVVVPVLLLFGLLKLDPRVRAARQIERESGLPVLGTVPRLLTKRRRSQSMRQVAMASLLFLAVPIAYGVVLTLKLVHAL